MGHSKADHSVSPPRVEIPRDYNAAEDLIGRNLAAGRGQKTAYIDDAGSYSYAELGARRIGERIKHDASSGVLPEETASEWGEEWLKLARQAAAQEA